MKSRILPIIVAALALTACGSQKQTQLFNGKDFEGWVPVVDQKDTTGTNPFSVKDGCIAIAGQPYGYLRTEKVYGDYKAHLEFRWTDENGSNSGFFQRVQNDDTVWPHGIEGQLCHGSLGEFVALSGAKIEGVTPVNRRRSERRTRKIFGEREADQRVRHRPHIRLHRRPVRRRSTGGPQHLDRREIITLATN